MNKGLKALEELCDDINACVNSGGIHFIDTININTIKKELENYESCDKERLLLIEEKHFLIKECLKIGKENDKLKKILKIIKIKGVSVGLLYLSKSLGEYNEYHAGEEKLTQEEYDLLREGFL